MTRRSTIWLVVALAFTLLNLGFAVAAAVTGEPIHAGVHVVLMLVGAWFTTRIWRREHPEAAELPDGTPDRLTNLEQSIDAVAIEVERIGEGQRFMTRALTERAPPPVTREGAEPNPARNEHDIPPHG